MRLPPITDGERIGTNDVKVKVPAPVGGYDELDLKREMEFGEFSDSEALEQHGPKEIWWGSLLADQLYAENKWKETAYDVYMAHLRTYAIHCLRGQGIRRSDCAKQDIHDVLIRMYSESTPTPIREELAQYAFLGYMQEKLGSRASVLDLHRRDPDEYARQFKEFYSLMYAFQQGEDPVWMEQAIERRLLIERSRAIVEAVVSAFRSRGFLLRQGAENEKARKNMFGITIDEMVDRVAEKLGMRKAIKDNKSDDSDTWVRD